MRDDAERGAGAAWGSPSMPPELDHAFRLVVIDWIGTAVPSGSADASPVVGMLDRLLAAGVRVAVLTGTSFANLMKQLGGGVAAEHARRLFAVTDRGAEAYGFDRHGEPFLLHRRPVTPEEQEKLDAVAEGVSGALSRRTGLPFAVIRDRPHRRRIDLIPEPAWEHPPESAIGVLLAATEGRLRGAGLRGGLREAFTIAAEIARASGLGFAKITSDGKHVELSFADHADGMALVLKHVAVPLAIAPADMLVVGDRYGSIAGLAGSDQRALTLAGMEGAVVVSVGIEPGGVPPPVLHFGGGPARLGEILEHQIELDARRGPFAPPRDAAWVIDEPGFDREREREIESLLAIGNGYLGSRGSLAEGTSASRPATLLAGAFEPSADISRVPELLVLPDWGRLRLTIGGDPFSVETNEVFSHRRTLDTRRGLLLREGVVRGPGGHVTRLRTFHLASLADRHLLAEGVEICPLNYSGTVRVEAILSGEVRSESGALHWEGFEGRCTAAGPLLSGRSRGGLTVAMASHLSMDVTADDQPGCDSGPTWASERYDVALRLGEPRELRRAVVLYSSRDVPDPALAVEGRLALIEAAPPGELLARHEAAWAERWRLASVDIDGAPGIERALRFALYHLISTANPEDPRSSIGARSLSGEGYRGHVFWDVEVFMLPFFVHAYPEAARALLTYRYLTLPGARRKAASLGYRGALYAWESADTGDETTPAAVLSPRGEIVRVLCGEMEHHISADVAWAVWLYERSTADHEFARGPGRSILLETARFWASRVVRGDDGLYHVRQVIGPDEYHEAIDDSAFTNWMARFNLRRAADAAEAVLREDPLAAAALGVTEDEIASFRRIAAAMALGLDERTGIIEEFAGFHALDPVDPAALAPGQIPADMLLGREAVMRCQLVKQADVVQLIALLWDEIPPEVRLRSFLHYEPRTAHTSSLSPGIHALVAARLGLFDLARQFLERTAEIDLGNTMGNAAGGVHAAALGSLWQAVVLGVGGVRPDPGDAEGLIVAPNLLPGWRHLGFPLLWRGRLLRFDVEPRAVELTLAGDAPVPVRAVHPSGAAASILAEPGGRYILRSSDGGVAWERVIRS